MQSRRARGCGVLPEGCHEAYYSGGVARRVFCTKKAKEEATQQLRSAVSAFYLRRAASDIASASLPPKTVHIVCCRMVDEQREAYEEACELRDGGALATIQKLRALATRGPARNPLHEPSSGKLRVAFALLQHLRETGPERVVIASGSTATLDVIQACCDARDGGTGCGSTERRRRRSGLDSLKDLNREDLERVRVFVVDKGGWLRPEPGRW